MFGSFSRSRGGHLGVGRHAVLQRRRGRHQLEGRSRRVDLPRGPVGQRSGLVLGQRAPALVGGFDVVVGDGVGVVAGAGHHRQHGTGPGVEGDHGTLLVAQRVGGRLLHPGHDRGLHARPLLRAVGDQVDQTADEQRVVGAGELRVVRVLQTGPAVVVGVVAGDHGVEVVVGVDPLEPEPVVGGLRLGHRHLAGGQDGAAVLGELGVPGASVLAVGVQAGLPEQDRVGDVAQQQGEHHHGHESDPADRLVHAAPRTVAGRAISWGRLRRRGRSPSPWRSACGRGGR